MELTLLLPECYDKISALFGSKHTYIVQLPVVIAGFQIAEEVDQGHQSDAGIDLFQGTVKT